MVRVMRGRDGRTRGKCRGLAATFEATVSSRPEWRDFDEDSVPMATPRSRARRRVFDDRGVHGARVLARSLGSGRDDGVSDGVGAASGSLFLRGVFTSLRLRGLSTATMEKV